MKRFLHILFLVFSLATLTACGGGDDDRLDDDDDDDDD